MPSSSQVIGPCFIYAGVGSNKAPLFLGVCETSPQIAIKHEWVPLMNALGGASIESDSAYQGMVADIRMDLTRWTEAVHLAMTAVPDVGGTQGFSAFGDLGALMITENFSYPVWFKFPYASKAVYQAAGMPAGYRFVACWIANDDLGNLDTRPRKISLNVRARRLFNFTQLSWTLYDFNVAGLPNIS